MLVKELQHAARNLRRTPRFSLACVVTLALALAGTITLLNLLEGFVFRRLAVSAPDQLIGLYPTTGGDFSVGFSAPVLHALSDRQQTLVGVCGVTAGYGASSVQFEFGAARPRPIEAVTGNCYELLGVTASMGRLIASADAPPTGPPGQVAVISDRVWRQEFGATPDVLGRLVRLEGTALTIIGVLPATYRGVNADEAPDIAVPITLPWTLKLQPPLAMHAVGRLRPGTAFSAAAAHLTAIWPDVFTSTAPAPAVVQSIPRLRTVPLQNGFSILRERYRRPLYALVALAGCLLLLACANVGGLSTARLLDRRQAFAVQLALGAGRSRLAVQLLCEALLIGTAAVVVAVLIGRWGSRLSAHLLWTGDRAFTREATPFLATLLSTVAVGALASLVVAAPGWVALSVHDWDLGARSARPSTRRGRGRVVVAAQIALCFVLAFCAALFGGNLSGLRHLPLGYDPGGLQWVRLVSTSSTPSAPTIGYADTLIATMEALPGVAFAALSQGAFGTTSRVADTVPVRRAAEATSVDALMDRVSPGFFRTTAIPLQQGRDFTWIDVRNHAEVTILNRSLADRLFPGGDAVGQTIRLGRTGQVRAIIGVAADATPGDPRLQEVPQYYVPLGATAPVAPALLLRLRGAEVAPATLREIVESSGRHQILRVGTMRDEVERFFVQERLIATASALFAALAAIVSIVGLYATMAQSISRRTREIGIRIAVGATPDVVRTLVLAEVCWMVLVGLGLGIPAALVGGHAARPLLSGPPTNTIALIVLTGLSIAGSAVLVSAWPAQRAARTPVATALRSE